MVACVIVRCRAPWQLWSSGCGIRMWHICTLLVAEVGCCGYASYVVSGMEGKKVQDS